MLRGASVGAGAGERGWVGGCFAASLSPSLSHVRVRAWEPACLRCRCVCVCVCVCTEGHTRQQGLKGLEMNALLDDRFHCSLSLGFQVFAAVLIQVHLLCVCALCVCVCVRARECRQARTRNVQRS